MANHKAGTQHFVTPWDIYPPWCRCMFVVSHVVFKLNFERGNSLGYALQYTNNLEPWRGKVIVWCLVKIIDIGFCETIMENFRFRDSMRGSVQSMYNVALLVISSVIYLFHVYRILPWSDPLYPNHSPNVSQVMYCILAMPVPVNM